MRNNATPRFSGSLAAKKNLVYNGRQQNILNEINMNIGIKEKGIIILANVGLKKYFCAINNFLKLGFKNLLFFLLQYSYLQV